MHTTIQNLLEIQNKVKLNLNKSIKKKVPKIIAVSKTFDIEKILPLINHGHIDFGENKVQEAIIKWKETKHMNNKIKLHMVGKLQTNKVKLAVEIFDFIHSLDNEKLAQKLSVEIKNKNKDLKFFIQVNIGNEEQKSGIKITELNDFYNYCISLDLKIIGLMCIPPLSLSSSDFYKKMFDLNNKLGLAELSMGMSSDYLEALKYSASYIRIGSKIFGNR
jgi:pyridoxal phosphate enzyme (YggS family)